APWPLAISFVLVMPVVSLAATFTKPMKSRGIPPVMALHLRSLLLESWPVWFWNSVSGPRTKRKVGCLELKSRRYIMKISSVRW
ncbi:hypothetical protein KXW60_007551, partial [Aspergillus fumigatus]